MDRSLEGSRCDGQAGGGIDRHGDNAGDPARCCRRSKASARATSRFCIASRLIRRRSTNAISPRSRPCARRRACRSAGRITRASPRSSSARCLRWGANTVEFHIDIDGQGAEYPRRPLLVARRDCAGDCSAYGMASRRMGAISRRRARPNWPTAHGAPIRQMA